MKQLFSTAYFLGHDLIGSNVRRSYNEFLSIEKASRHKLEKLEEQRLRTLLMHAASNVPFYRERITSPEASLNEYPVLTKDDVLREFENLMTPELKREFQTPALRNGYSWVEVKTGGTTGVPTTVIHDKQFRDQGRASRLFSQHLCGFPLGTPYWMLWGSMRDINHMTDSAPKRIMQFLSRARLMNAFQMDPERMKEYTSLLNRSSSRNLMAYVDAADELARYIQTSGLHMEPIESLMACAGTLTEDVRTRLHDVFGCRVHNKYGSRDCGDIACECEAGGLHIYSHHVHLEIVDQQGKPVPPGKSGRMLVTLLSNFGFPMIRYDIGDVGHFSKKSCPCGRPFPLLGGVEGRSIESLKDTKGNFVTPAYIVHLIGVVHNQGNRLKRFQLTQTGKKEHRLLLQAEKADQTACESVIAPNICRDLKKVLGVDAVIDISVVDYIQPEKSGKFLSVRNLTANRALSANS